MHDFHWKKVIFIKTLKFNPEEILAKAFNQQEVELIEEVNKLEWVNIDDNFFDLNKYAGEGNIGHIMIQIKKDLNLKIED